jgi:molecular chaperone DnaK
MAEQNVTLGKFQLVGIPPAPRGVPQIEVTFDIDANGITHVSAKDLATGNEQSITITATTNLSDTDVERMVRESEEYAEEDEKRRALVEAKNMADQMIYQGEKLVKDFGDKIPDDLKKELEQKSEVLKNAIEIEDFEKLKSGTEDLQQTIYKITEKVYGAAGPGAAGPGAAGFDPSQMGFDPSQMAGAKTSSDDKEEDDEDVVDVDFEDID